jgi:16S rRNA (guanine527-N7)-methyltransferase
LYLATRLPEGPLRIIDIGSGAGFPGIPVAIYRPECTVDLVEAHQRKAVFLREAARNLTNVRVLAQRAEAVTDSYDWTISRAVRQEDVLKLNLAPHVAVLGTEGESLPWGEHRALFTR